MKYKNVAQMKLDIMYDEPRELASIIEAIHSINKNSEWKCHIPPQCSNTEDMTKWYEGFDTTKH